MPFVTESMSNGELRKASSGSVVSVSSTTSSQRSPRSLARLTRPVINSGRTSSLSEHPAGNNASSRTVQDRSLFSNDEAVNKLSSIHGLPEDPYLNVCICHPEPKIPRPRNAFILYRQHHQAHVILQNPNLTNPEISKIIGEQWRHQAAEVKNEWKRLAEEEKARHQSQYPEYRYQPRRPKRRASSITDSTSVLSPIDRCGKCGGHSTSTFSPTTPTPTENHRPMLPPLTPTSAGPDATNRFFPRLNSQGLISPYNGPPIAVHPGNFALVPYPTYFYPAEDGDGRMATLSPDGKRRRLNNGTPFPANVRASISAPTAARSPFRESFSSGDRAPKPVQPANGFMGPPPKPGSTSLLQQHRPRSLTLPPLRLNNEQGRTAEAMIKQMPHQAKIGIIGRISPALRTSTGTETSKVRGAIIAVEGDNQAAVAEIAAWLIDHLSHKPEYSIRTGQGPKLTEADTVPTIPDYLTLVRDWHDKAKKMVEFITTAPPLETQSQDAHNTGMDIVSAADSERTPIIILERYQLHASDAFASKIPISDNYSPIDHWQWMATMWRDIVGPDITVYVKDVLAEEFAAATDQRVVDVKEDVKCITLVRRTGPGPVVARFEDKELRRLAFEIGEMVGAVGKLKGVSGGGAVVGVAAQLTASKNVET